MEKYKKIINKILISEIVGPKTIDIGSIDNKEKKNLLLSISII